MASRRGTDLREVGARRPPSSGVPTAMKTNSACRNPSTYEVVKREPARGESAADHLLQTRLVDGQDTVLQALDFVPVHVDADHPIAHLGKGGARGQPDVPGSDDSDALHVSRIAERRFPRLRVMLSRPDWPERRGQIGASAYN